VAPEIRLICALWADSTSLRSIGSTIWGQAPRGRSGALAGMSTSAPPTPADEQKAFRRDLRRLTNGVQAEMHLRASFAVSCLISCAGRLRPGNDVPQREFPERVCYQRSSRLC